MTVEVHREGKSWIQVYEKGKPMSPVRQNGKAGDNGTITTFLPDREIFKDGIEVNFDHIKKVIKDRAYLIAKLHFHLLDERVGSECNFYFEGGITSLVKSLNRNKISLTSPIFISRQSGEDNITAEIAILYND
jgi:DNA gyrase subunit B